MKLAAAPRSEGQRLLAVFAAITMVLSLMLVFASPAGADGDGSPDACKEVSGSVDGSVTGTDDLVTYTAPDGKIVDGVCIKSGENMFGGNQHSGVLGDGTYESACYTVSGVGTQTVTVSRTGTAGPNCQEISHIDVVLADEPEPEPDRATASVNGMCVEGSFVVIVNTSNATVGVDLDGDGTVEAGESGLTTGSFGVTADVDDSIAWAATADADAAFEGTAPSGSITVLDCVEDEAEMGTVAIIKKADDDKSVEFAFQGDLAGSIAHDEMIEIDAEVGVSYSSTEVMVDGWYLDKISCEADGGQFDIDEALLTVSMMVTEEGGSVICFFDNENLADSEGAILIRKLVTQGSDTEQEFTFNTDDFTVADNTLGHGDQASADVNPGDYAVSEVVPEGWDLLSAVCESTEAADDSTPEDIDISANEIVTCTFTNAEEGAEVGSILVTKSAGADSVTAPAQVTFTVTVENTSAVQVTIEEIVDSVFGEIAPAEAEAVVSTDCEVPQTLAPDDGTDGSGDDFYSCQFVGVVTAEEAGVHVNVVTVSGTDVGGNPVSDTGEASVIIDEVGGVVITPESPAAPVTPVTGDTDVQVEELPFTGIETDRLLGLAIMLLGSGVLLLRVAPRREIDIFIER